MKHWKFIILLFCGLFMTLLGGCVGSNNTGLNLTVQLQETDPAKPIEVEAGQEFSIIILSNPTTGYEWRTVEAVDTAVIEHIKTDFSAADPTTEGSGGWDVWQFKAIAPGETTITLGHYPPSGADAEPEQTATYTVIVR